MKIKFLLIGICFLLAQIAFASYEMSSVNIPEEAKPKLDKQVITAKSDVIKEKGYIERTSLKYEYLSGIEQRITFESQGNIKSTKLRKNLSEIVRNASLKTVPLTAKSATLGYAPIGAFDEDTGWTGVTEIFKSETAGICQFSHLDLRASKGAYSLSREDETREVNNKYTYIEVTGKKDEGLTIK